jgi:hypothetical protein
MGAETVPEPEGRQSEQQSRDWLSLENGRRGVEGQVVTEEEGGHVEVEAPPGRLGLRFETDTGHRVIYMAPTSALAGRVSVGDRLVSIRAPGRSLFVCGPNTYGHNIVQELQAAAAGPGRVLSFAVARAARPAPTGGTREVRAPSGPLGVFFDAYDTSHRSA